MRFSPLFDKEGKGRFSNRMTQELYSELLGQDTRSASLIVILRGRVNAPMVC